MIILTGAAGFIGSNILQALNEAGREDVIAVDDIGDTGKWANIAGRRFYDYVPKDELPAWLERERPAKLTAIIHMGACSDTREQRFDYLMENNVRYSQRLWSLAAERRVPFIYASSAATYGDGSAGYSDDHSRSRDLRPLNGYGMSKQIFDRWALHQETRPARWYGLKFFNVYGPREDHKGSMASMVLHGFNQGRKDGRIRLFKSYRADVPDGEQKRDFIFIGDVVSVVLNFMTSEADAGLYNVGSGEARSFNDLAKAVFATLEVPPAVEYIDMPPDLRGGYQYYTKADITKLRHAGFLTRPTSLEAGVGAYVGWLKARSNWTAA